MRYVLFLLAAGLLPVLSGCLGGTSVTDVDPVPPGTRHHGRPVLGIITAENRGVYLFKYIPIWSGDPRHPNFRQYDMFTDRLKTGYMDLMLEEEGRRLNADKLLVRNCTENAGAWFSLWILWVRQMHSEAVALGPEGAPDVKR